MVHLIEVSPGAFMHYRKGDLALTSFTKLESLPDNLIVTGYLNLDNCTSLRSLPRNLQVVGHGRPRSGSIMLANCPLQSLPDDMHIDSDLFLSDCISLRSLPHNTHARYTKIDGCTSLLSHIPSCVYTDLAFVNNHIVGVFDGEPRCWCEENDIQVVEQTFYNTSCPITCHVINDPAQLAYYRLRWG